MCGSRSQTGRCPQNTAVPLVCPLDIQGACDSSVFGDVIRNSESTSNTGLFNFNWRAQIEGSSLLLGIVLGFILTILLQYLIRYIKQRRKQGRWPRGLAMPGAWWGQNAAVSPLQQPMLAAAPASPAPAPAPTTMALSPASPHTQFAPQQQQQPMAQPQSLPLPPPIRLF